MADAQANTTENKVIEAAPALGELAGKVAVVTGASAGIGRACAAALANLNMRVAACARREEKLHELRDQLAADGKLMDQSRFMPLACDVQSEEDIQKAMACVQSVWKCAPTVVLNCAGLSREDTSMLDGSTQSWAEMFNVNVLGAAVATREAVALMRKHGTPGHIVNISSLSAYRIPKFSGGGWYAATKHALRCISDGTRAEAQQAKLPLRVSCISPGVVDSEFYQVRHGGARSVQSVYDFDVLETQHIVQALLYVLGAPPQVNVDDVIVRPIGQPM